MRQILRNCGGTQMMEAGAGGGEFAPLWLRSAAGGQSSLPGTQSPQRRTLNRPNGGAAAFMMRTPELGRQFLANRRESPPVPLAAPPYQRMASLPPQIDGNGGQTNSFGTLQVNLDLKPKGRIIQLLAHFIIFLSNNWQIKIGGEMKMPWRLFFKYNSIQNNVSWTK